MTNLKKIEKTAKKAAILAGEVLKKYFKTNLDIEVKNEISPLVTIADKEAELIMRKLIGAVFPEHIIVGEEFGTSVPLEQIKETNKISWTLDPIDGTTAFTAGLPTFVVLIGVWQGDKPLLGLIYQPITDYMWIACGAQKTLFNGQQCLVGQNHSNNNALIVATTSPNYFSDKSLIWWQRLNEVATTAVFGGDGLLYGSLASGHISLILEKGLKWHDVAALIPILNNAGCVITDHDKQPLKPYQELYSVIAARDESILNNVMDLKS